LIQVKSERQVFTHNVIEVTSETRYYISSLSETAQEIAERIRGYWGVENKVHYVRDVTQGEDVSRIRTTPRRARMPTPQENFRCFFIWKSLNPKTNKRRVCTTLFNSHL
jgi:hypothetical protein